MPLSVHAWIIVGLVGGGLLGDATDWLTYDPPGAIGFERQLGPLGMLGRLAWIVGVLWFCGLAIGKVLT